MTISIRFLLIIWCQNHAPNLAKKVLVGVIKKEKIRRKKIKVIIIDPFLFLKIRFDIMIHELVMTSLSIP